MLALNRLDRRSRTALVEQIAGGKTLPDDVVAQIIDRTDGVPLFIEELTKSVLEKPLGERRELALDIGRLLRLQLRRTELVVAGTCMRRKAESRRVGSPAKTRRMAGLSSRRVCPT